MLSDLHCHILPGVDDGAENMDVTERMLRAERDAGVRQIIFTPHFYAERQDVDVFLARRADAVRQVKKICSELQISQKAGAEVYMSSELLEVDLPSLCMGDTNYLLLEWPSVYPLWGEEMVDHLLDQGIRPVFAHIERYSCFFAKEKNLDPYIRKGALCQMNAGTLLKPDLQKRALELIRRKYVHILSSDAHNMRSRAPHTAEAYEVIKNRLGGSWAEKLAENASAVFHGEDLCIEDTKKRFGWW
ncbi:MAG: hypothetical protein KH452_01390 [Clostridiales bacterium]|nr:hypothetical protein [Clostridiales bacterium]